MQGKWSCNSGAFPRAPHPAETFDRRNKMIGIYKIENTLNGNIYIGQSIHVEGRWRQHLHLLNKGSHFNKYIQKDFDAYGKSVFTFTPLLYCDIETLTLYEQVCVSGLSPKYNINEKCIEPSRGIKRTEEYKNYLSLSRRGKTKRVLEREQKFFDRRKLLRERRKSWQQRWIDKCQIT